MENSKLITIVIAVISFGMAFIISPYVSLTIYRQNDPLAKELRTEIRIASERLVQIETVQQEHNKKLDNKLDKNELKRIDEALSRGRDNNKEMRSIILELSKQLVKLETIVEKMEDKNK